MADAPTTDDETLARYLDGEGRMTRWPTRRNKKDQTAILAYLASKFTEGQSYTERQVNDILRQFHTFEDWALLRRALFEQGFLNRTKDGASYWRTASTHIY
jgi:hypothetical protein